MLWHCLYSPELSKTMVQNGQTWALGRPEIDLACRPVYLAHKYFTFRVQLEVGELPPEGLLTDAFACIFCNSNRSRLRYEACRDLYLGTSFVVDYVRCEGCGLLQQHPTPPDVSAYYRDYPVHRARAGLVERMARYLMKDVYRPCSDLALGTTLLDYGCGSGAYLEGLRGSRPRLAGFELDPAQAAQVADRLGISVFSDTDRLEEALAGVVDVVTMHFVLEHVTDLHGTIALVSRLLRPGGELYIVVPDAASWELRLFGKAWHSLDPPRHISFPDVAVVDGLARAHGMRLAQLGRSRSPTA